MSVEQYLILYLIVKHFYCRFAMYTHMKIVLFWSNNYFNHPEKLHHYEVELGITSLETDPTQFMRQLVSACGEAGQLSGDAEDLWEMLECYEWWQVKFISKLFQITKLIRAGTVELLKTCPFSNFECLFIIIILWN